MAIYDSRNNVRYPPVAEKTFRSSLYSSLEEIIEEFMSEQYITVERAIFGVAGPVIDGKSKITNLPWEMDEKIVQDSVRIQKVHMMNDLEAMAYFIPYLEQSEYVTLNEGKPVPKGNIALLAPGTGLGEAFLTWEGGRYHSHACEGGHVDFAPTTPLQVKMLEKMKEKYSNRVCVERLCSGIGIKNIYEYLKGSGITNEPSWLAERLESAEDPVPVIAETFLKHEGKSELCDVTMKSFISILGTEAGNFALKVMALNGIYLGGGIPLKILPGLQKEIFKEAMCNKGRMTELISRIPVRVILNSKIALLGAAQHAFDTIYS
jgi:glucokinase